MIQIAYDKEMRAHSLQNTNTDASNSPRFNGSIPQYAESLTNIVRYALSVNNHSNSSAYEVPNQFDRHDSNDKSKPLMFPAINQALKAQSKMISQV